MTFDELKTEISERIESEQRKYTKNLIAIILMLLRIEFL